MADSGFIHLNSNVMIVVENAGVSAMSGDIPKLFPN